MIRTLDVEVVNTNRNENTIALENSSRGFLFHTAQKQTTSGLMLCSPEAAFYSVTFYMLERGLNKTRRSLPKYTCIY